MTRDRRLGRGLAALLGTPVEHDGLHSSSPRAVPPAGVTHPDDSAENSGASSTPYGGDERRLPMESDAPVDRSFAHATYSSPGGETRDETSDEPDADRSAVVSLDIDAIEQNPFQPRREFNPAEIASLAESLKEHDLLQPILVRQVAGRYQLISGERRWRAAREAGWTRIPAQVREADDRLVAELAIVENLQRKDLNAIEKALSFKRYLDEHQATQDELARRLKIDRSTIANLMRLLELPEPIRQSVQSGELSAGHARALLPLGDERQQLDFARRIQSEGLSVREVERQVQDQIQEEDAEPFSPIAGVIGKPRTRNDQIESLEQRLRTALGTRVEIRQSSRGRGKITIHFGSHDEFHRIWQHMTDDNPSRADFA